MAVAALLNTLMALDYIYVSEVTGRSVSSRPGSLEPRTCLSSDSPLSPESGRFGCVVLRVNLRSFVALAILRVSSGTRGEVSSCLYSFKAVVRVPPFGGPGVYPLRIKIVISNFVDGQGVLVRSWRGNAPSLLYLLRAVIDNSTF